MAPMSVIIVGGGPSGLLLARLLAQSGLRNIRLLERDPGPTHDYRAFLYQPIAFHEFQRAGIWDEVQAKATPLRSVCWRDAADAGKRLFGMPSKDTLLMSLNTLTGIIRTQLEQSNQGQILYGHEVTDVGQDGDIAWVDVQTPQGRRRMDASYVIGCDGGQSTVRKLAFGPGAMKGFTWDKQLVTADVSAVLECITDGSSTDPSLLDIRFKDTCQVDLRILRTRTFLSIPLTHGFFSACLKGTTCGVSYIKIPLLMMSNLLQMPGKKSICCWPVSLNHRHSSFWRPGPTIFTSESLTTWSMAESF